MAWVPTVSTRTAAPSRRSAGCWLLNAFAICAGRPGTHRGQGCARLPAWPLLASADAPPFGSRRLAQVGEHLGKTCGGQADSAVGGAVVDAKLVAPLVEHPPTGENHPTHVPLALVRLTRSHHPL